MQNPISEIEIEKIKNGQREFVKDIVVKEIPLIICCNNVEIATLLCTPGYEKELAIGFLAAAGLISDIKKITAIDHDEEEQAVFVKYEEDDKNQQSFLRRYITTGCGLGTMFSSGEELLGTYKYEGKLQLKTENIFELVKQLQNSSQLYLSTGGVHSAALSDGESILLFREDIGRHNAVDKIIGHVFLNRISLADKVLITSGRISSEIVLKLAKAGIGGIISRSAPMDRAVEYAKVLNMTVIGFVRGRRMNIYCGNERITDL